MIETQYNLVYYGNKTLRTEAKDIENINSEILDLSKQMFKIMEKEQGIGLAAPQIDVSLKLIAIDLRTYNGPMMALVNPKIIEYSNEKEPYEEGCLSLPGITAEIIRPFAVKVNAYSLQGKEVNIEADKLLARVLQHEIDHLHGKLFIDYLEDYKRKELHSKLKKIKKMNK